MRNRIIALGVMGGLFFATVVYLLFFKVGLSLGEFWQILQSFIRSLGETHPLYMCLIVAVGPAIGLPVVLLYLLSGVIYGVKLGLIIIAFGLLGNLLITYFLSAKLLHRFFKKFLLKRGYNLHSVKSSSLMQLIILMRLIPGIPLVVQNYFLGMLRVPLKSYVLISWLLLYPWAVGFVISGNAAFEGRFKGLILGVALILLFVLAARFISSRYVESKRNSVE